MLVHRYIEITKRDKYVIKRNEIKGKSTISRDLSPTLSTTILYFKNEGCTNVE